MADLPQRCLQSSTQHQSEKEKKRGGSRRKLSWAEKVDLCDSAAVTTFLQSEVVCGCGKECLEKVRKLGNKGVLEVQTLRQERCAGTYKNDSPHSVFFVVYCTPGVR